MLTLPDSSALAGAAFEGPRRWPSWVTLTTAAGQLRSLTSEAMNVRWSAVAEDTQLWVVSLEENVLNLWQTSADKGFQDNRPREKVKQILDSWYHWCTLAEKLTQINATRSAQA